MLLVVSCLSLFHHRCPFYVLTCVVNKEIDVSHCNVITHTYFILKWSFATHICSMLLLSSHLRPVKSFHKGHFIVSGPVSFFKRMCSLHTRVSDSSVAIEETLFITNLSFAISSVKLWYLSIPHWRPVLLLA